MKNTFTKIILSSVFMLLNFTFVKAQNLVSISPDIAQQGQTLTTTITGSGNIFVPGSPMGGYDIRMIKSGGSYEIDSDFGSVVYNNSNNVNAHWTFSGGAPSGMYDLIVDATDGSGGWASYTLPSIFQVGCLIALSETHSNTTCGNTNGSIDLTAISGTPPYAYAWSNGATTEDLSSLAQGIYSVTVTDASPCGQVLNNIIIGNTNGPAVTESHLSSTCANANGSVNITVTGGTSPYTFNWNNGATTEDINSILAGSYLVTVTDLNSCEGYVSTTVLDSNELAMSVTSSQYNCSNQGIVTANVTSGTAPYAFAWSNGATSMSLSNVPSGNYIVTVTDALGCIQIGNNFINSNFNFYVYLASGNSNCTGNGTVTSLISGGTSPYTYIWSNGATDANLTGLNAGTYSVTVTDNIGCTRTGYTSVQSSNYNVIEGYVFHDLNGNCVQDTGELPLSGISVHAAGAGGGYYATSNSYGYYSLHILVAGTYSIDAVSGYGSNCNSYSLCGNASGPIVISGNCDTVSNCNFGYTNIPGFDLTLHPGWSSANPGFQKEMWILYYYNSGNPFTDTATIVFHYDTALVYQYSLAPLPVHDIVAHTLTWQVTNLTSGCCSWPWTTRLRNFFLVPASTPVGYMLTSDYTISPTIGDCNPGNNFMTYSHALTGSLDPNEKSVSPEGNLMNADSVLTYTIEFQNTGNDTTNFIIVIDTLSQFLDPMTVENLFSSHAYSDFSISESGILTWTFNPIYLVDSATNEPASHGFITFKIKVRSNLPFGTQITNNASIYFDYNQPVVTNTVQNTVINSVKNISDKTVTVVAYPNPFFESTMFVVNGINGEYNFELTNLLGEKVKEIKHINAKQFTFNRTDLAQGIYFYIIVVEGKTIATGKIVAD